MKRLSLAMLAGFLPCAATAGPFPLPPGLAAKGSVAAMPAQYDGYYDYPAAPELREFIDRNGNRVFVNEYGEVISIVPPVDAEARFRDRPRGLPGGDYVLEGPVDPYDPYAEIDPYPPRPAPGYRQRFDEPRDPVIERREPENPESQFGRGPDVYRSPSDDLQPGSPQPYTPPARADGLNGDAVMATSPRASAEVAALQILLDRAGTSPGVIDGLMGSNVRKALTAYERKTGASLDPEDVEAIMDALNAQGGLPIKQYTITEDDVAGPFIDVVPADYGEKAKLDALSYTSVAEMLAERFHMDESYLRSINPNADFSRPGTVIKVASVGPAEKAKVARIVADKSRKQVLAYSEAGELIAAYPATIGSLATPSPSGTHTVERIALDPNYTYNPNINFKQGDNDEVLTIPPGPNGPVGSVWIALSKPTYGIHGTPDPAAIGKTESNGCVRLTNWDAKELAAMVEPGVTVEFVDDSGLMVSGTDSDAGAGTAN